MMSRVTLPPAATTSGLVKNVWAVSTLPCPPGPGTTKDANWAPPAGTLAESPVADPGSVKKPLAVSSSRTSKVVRTPTPTPT